MFTITVEFKTKINFKNFKIRYKENKLKRKHILSAKKTN